MAIVDKKEFKVFGKRLPRKEGPNMATGRFKHVGDYQFPGMLHGVYLCSPYAHANIKRIDTSKAKALPGVRAVLTHADIGDVAMSKVATMNMFPLCEKARAVGDAIAAVAADTLDIAEEAINLIEVDYEVLPHVTDVLEAMKPDAPQIHANDHGQSKQPGNFRIDTDVDRYGNREVGIKASDKIFEWSGNWNACLSNHNSSLRCTLVHWERENYVKIWTETQGVFEDRGNIDRDLRKFHNLTISGIECICECAGGGFGSNKFGRHSYLALLLSLATGKKTVRVEHSRRLELGFEAHGRSGIYTQKLRVGIKSNGDLTFVDWHNISQQGAYSQDTTSFGDNWTTHKVDNNHEKCQEIYTNTAKGGWKRGVSGPLCVWPQDVALDEIAESLGKTPWDYQYQIMADDFDHGTAAKLPWISNLTRECLNRALAASNMKTKWKGWKTPVSVAGSKKRGIGLALSRQPCGNAGGSCYAKLMEEGQIYGFWGTTNVGNGQPTTQSMALAEAVGVSYDMVTPFTGSTQYPSNPRSAASVMALSTTRATILCGEKLKKIILDDWAAPLFKVKAGELEMEEGVIWVKADPTKKMTLREATQKFPRTPDFSPFGNWPVIDASAWTDNVKNVASASWGVYIIEVEVDTDTGLVDIIDFWSAQDCGRPINPMVVENQTQGGAIEGIGMALMEARLWDKQSGVCLTTDWLHYLEPTYLDMAKGWINPLIFDKPDDPNCPLGPYGAKGFAEGASQAVHPAVSNAIYNACGVRMYVLPITPEKILKALGKG